MVLYELSISGQCFSNKDPFAHTDSVVVLFTQDQSAGFGASGHWFEYSRSELVENDDSPHYVTPFILDYVPNEQRRLRFILFHTDNANGKLKNANLIGEVHCMLNDVTTAPGGVVTVDVRNIKTNVSRGKLTIRGEELRPVPGRLDVSFGATKLKRPQVFGKCDPFLVVTKAGADGQRGARVALTAPARKTQSPSWPDVSVSIQRLCNGDESRVLYFDVYDHKPASSSGGKLLGSAKMPYSEFKKMQFNNQVPLMLPKKGDNPKDIQTGLLLIKKITVVPDVAPAALPLSMSPEAIAKRTNPTRETVSKLLKLLESANESEQREAANSLANLAHNSPENQAAVRELGGIPILVARLGTTSTQIQLAVSWSLKNLACDAANRDAIREANGIGALVLLLDKDDEVVRQALWALSNLIVGSDENRANLRSYKGIPRIVSLLSSPNPGVVEQAANAVAGLCFRSDENKQCIVDAGGIPALVKVISSENVGAATFAAWALKNLATVPQHRNAVRQAGGIEALVKLLSSANADCQRQASWALANLSDGSPDNARCIQQSEGVDALKSLVASAPEPVKRQATIALSNIEASGG